MDHPWWTAAKTTLVDADLKERVSRCTIVNGCGRHDGLWTVPVVIIAVILVVIIPLMHVVGTFHSYFPKYLNDSIDRVAGEELFLVLPRPVRKLLCLHACVLHSSRYLILQLRNLYQEPSPRLSTTYRNIEQPPIHSHST